jgi:putative FmdB family regulatory protein
MPLYEYECKSCSACFEELLPVSKLSTPTERPCPECGESTVKKAVSVTTMGVDMKLKTPGWFQDKISKMKEYTPKRFHGGLDKAADRNGGRFGPQ